MENKLKKIESAEHFVQWANAVNNASNKEICDLQDVFGHSSYADLYRIFNNDLSGSRSLVTFAINKCMGAEQFENFIKDWVAYRMNTEWQKIYDELTQELSDKWTEVQASLNNVNRMKLEFENEKAGLKNEVEQLTKRNTELTDHNDDLRKSLNDYEHKVLELEVDSLKLTKIIEVFQILQSHNLLTSR